MPDLARILSDLAVNEAVVRDLIEGLGDARLNWQQTPGVTWSVAQCIEHVALTNNSYVAAMVAAIRQVPRPKTPWTGPIRPSYLGRLFIRSIEPPVKGMKIKAPTVIAPSLGKTVEEVQAAFAESHGRIRSAVEQATGLDVNSVTFVNPFIPLLHPALGTGFQILMAHERRHLWQARNARRAALAA